MSLLRFESCVREKGNQTASVIVPVSLTFESCVREKGNQTLA